jgi:hypothetical protein
VQTLGGSFPSDAPEVALQTSAEFAAGAEEASTKRRYGASSPGESRCRPSEAALHFSGKGAYRERVAFDFSNLIDLFRSFESTWLVSCHYGTYARGILSACRKVI